MKDDLDSAALRKRLDTIILLLLENSPRGVESTVSKIERLMELGFTQPEVALMIGKKLNYVTAVISRKRSGGHPRRSGSEDQ